LHLNLVMLALLGLARRLLALAALLRLILLALILRSGAALLVTRARRATFHLCAARGSATGLAARHLLGRRDGNSCQQRSCAE
jgi:hypothetical protein